MDPNAEPVFATDFKSHMMQGTVKDRAHRGLHSLNLIKSQDYHIAPGNRVDDTTCPHIFSAKVQLVENMAEVQQCGKPRSWLDEKLSCFFPTSMTYTEIVDAVKLAYKNYKGGTTGMIRILPKHQPHGNEPPKADYTKAKSDSISSFNAQLKRLHVTDKGTKWPGQVRIADGSGSWVIWIGSPETGTSASTLFSAFPAVGGKFM